MLTTVHAETSSRCPFAIAEEYAIAYLRAAERGERQAVLRASLAPSLPVLSRKVWLSFSLATDVEESGRRHDEIRVRWDAQSRLYPDFRGTVRFRIESAATTRVVIDGTYEPPFGIIGRLFDALVGRRLAQATMHDLASRLGRELEEREDAWRKSHPVPA